MRKSESIESSPIESTHDTESVAASPIDGEKNGDDRPTLSRVASSIPEHPYSIFSRREKGIIVGIVALAALFSPFTINIYFPAILDIANDMGVTISLMNLTITIYMIFQGLAPGLFAAVSDSVGRRPTYIVCFIIFVASNIGLALTKTYWLLMLLRAIQATGNSATVALGAGVIADIATPNERGGYLGIFGTGPLAGPSLGPIIGGALAQTLGWRSIFWFLSIFGGVFSVFLVLFLPETLRSIVGNGSVRPTSIWQIRVIEMVWKRKNARGEMDSEERSLGIQHPTLADKKRTNIFESFKIIFQKDVALILFVPSIHYAIYVMITTSIPPLFTEHYHLSVLNIGLTYLAIGAGTLIGSVGWGKLLDRDWKYVEAQHIAKGYKKPKNPIELIDFPLEYARTRSTWYPLVAFWIGCAGYGWTVQYAVNLAVPLILQAVIGAAMVSIMSSFQALLIDLHPGRSASAAASLNIVRCWLGAGGSAVTQPMLTKMNAGWTYILLALLAVVFSIPAILAERKWGMTWRREREEKAQKKRETIRETLENEAGTNDGNQQKAS